MTPRLALLLSPLALLVQDHPPGGATPPPQAPGCALLPAGSLGARGATPIRTEVVVTGLEVPWGLAFLPGGDVLVTERPGRVRLVRGGKLLERPVLEVSVSRRSEDGLLGIALAADFAQTRRFFLYFTAEERGRKVNRVASYVLAPDGRLYVGTGDAGRPESAQQRDGLSGKILRVAPDGSIPRDNPFPGSPVYALGLRNVEAFDWRSDGALVIADHGPSGEMGRKGHDRVLVVPAPGADLGWPEVYGCGARAGMPGPVLSWTDAVPPGGGSFYTGDAIPDWKGSFLVGTLSSRHLHRILLDGARVARHEVYLEGDPPAGLGRLRDVVTGPDGALWVTTSNCDGRGTCPRDKDRIVRIVAR